MKNHKSDLCPAGKDKAKLLSKAQIEEAFTNGKSVLAKFASKVRELFKLGDSHEVDHKYMKKLGDIVVSDFF